MSAQFRSALLVALSLALVLASCTHDEPLPKLADVPAFALRDQSGRPITRDSLRGKVWVADFIFTSCPDVCPLLTEQLAGIRKRLPDDPRLAYVSFSVDPEHDTPEKLADFAAKHGASAPNWFFVTGPLDDVKHVVTEGFKQAMDAQPAEQGKPLNVLHGTHYVLVDRQGAIRGFHRSDTDGIKELSAAALRLLAEKDPAP
jgi:protein SCO1/2